MTIDCSVLIFNLLNLCGKRRPSAVASITDNHRHSLDSMSRLQLLRERKQLQSLLNYTLMIIFIEQLVFSR
jgi:hypothetical protein